jgi:hypothetical protein
MDTQELKIPRFRTSKRLVAWMENNWHRLQPVCRLPADREQVFFKTKKERPEELAACVASYAHRVGKLDEPLEELLKANHDMVISYAETLMGRDQEVPQNLMDSLAGDSRNLYRLGKIVGRLPEYLESTISEPRFAFMYSKEVLCGRLPSKQEDVFFGSEYYAAKYAFEVIRGFAPVRLPEGLHAFMVMKSFENPGNDDIRAYMEASDSDPNRVGNTRVRVN